MPREGRVSLVLVASDARGRRLDDRITNTVVVETDV